MNEIELSKKEIISEINNLKQKVDELGDGNSTLLKIAQESFIIGSKSHLNSLNPEIREELGLELDFMTQQDPKLKASYLEKKNKYLSLGKSYASIHPDGSKIEFGFNSISNDISEIFDWYYNAKEDDKISQLVVAILFHHKLVSIHPFLDGNGRISRLILNLILLKNGFFPVAIPNEKRKEYYESLVEADKGNLEPVVDYFSSLIKEKLEQYLSIANELNEIEDFKEYLVLTEDGNTSMISKILEIHNFDLNKVQLESYDGKDNPFLASVFFAKN
ncbi:MAG: Fic family protein [Saprospiraceae bacterium]|nr:Fic family protein [Saprospiraceae bacterium]